MNRILVVALISAGSVFAAGCGGGGAKNVPVKGQLITKDGPFKAQRPGGHALPPGDPGIRVKFTPAEAPPAGEDSFYYASVNPDDSTFDVPGKRGKGIPPGKYTVSIAVGAAGEPSAAAKAPPKGPPGGMKQPGGGGPPGGSSPSMDGVEVARKEVTVPDEGDLNLKIEIEIKK